VAQLKIACAIQREDRRASATAKPNAAKARPAARSTRAFGGTWTLSEKGVRLAQKVQVGPCIHVGIQLEKAEVGPISRPTLHAADILLEYHQNYTAVRQRVQNSQRLLGQWRPANVRTPVHFRSKFTVQAYPGYHVLTLD
jgi:hypothetical protein